MTADPTRTRVLPRRAWSQTAKEGKRVHSQGTWLSIAGARGFLFVFLTCVYYCCCRCVVVYCYYFNLVPHCCFPLGIVVLVLRGPAGALVSWPESLLILSGPRASRLSPHPGASHPRSTPIITAWVPRCPAAQHWTSKHALQHPNMPTVLSQTRGRCPPRGVSCCEVGWTP